jgi:hypothetical protein
MEYEPTTQEVAAAVAIILQWGRGFRDREMDVYAIARRILIAAHKAKE